MATPQGALFIFDTNCMVDCMSVFDIFIVYRKAAFKILIFYSCTAIVSGLTADHLLIGACYVDM